MAKSYKKAYKRQSKYKRTYSKRSVAVPRTKMTNYDGVYYAKCT